MLAKSAALHSSKELLLANLAAAQRSRSGGGGGGDNLVASTYQNPAAAQSSKDKIIPQTITQSSSATRQPTAFANHGSSLTSNNMRNKELAQKLTMYQEFVNRGKLAHQRLAQDSKSANVNKKKAPTLGTPGPTMQRLRAPPPARS